MPQKKSRKAVAIVITAVVGASLTVGIMQMSTASAAPKGTPPGPHIDTKPSKSDSAEDRAFKKDVARAYNTPSGLGKTHKFRVYISPERKAAMQRQQSKDAKNLRESHGG